MNPDLRELQKLRQQQRALITELDRVGQRIDECVQRIAGAEEEIKPADPQTDKITPYMRQVANAMPLRKPMNIKAIQLEVAVRTGPGCAMPKGLPGIWAAIDKLRKAGIVERRGRSEHTLLTRIRDLP